MTERKGRRKSDLERQATSGSLRIRSFKISPAVDAAIERAAERHGVSKSDIVREAVGEYLAGEAGETSFLALAHDLAGSVEGPEDLSTNPEHLADYGR